MTQPISDFVGLLVVLFLGSWGWGNVVGALLERQGWSDARGELGGPFQVAIGIALFLAVGGLLVAVNSAWFGILIAWHLLGVALLARRGTALFIRRRKSPLRYRPIVMVSLVVSGFFTLLIALAHGLWLQWINVNDDDSAYIYLAQRLLRTGGLIDPFNQRRVVSYGGSSLYQAMFLQASGASGTRGFELVFAALVALLLTCATTRRKYLLVGSALLGLGLIAGHETASIVNTSPIFSTAALSLAALILLEKLTSDDRARSHVGYPLLGLLLAGVLALRFVPLVGLGVTVVIVMFATMRPRQALLDLSRLLAVAVLASIGWAVASYRSSRTLLFPLFSGNYVSSFPGSRDPADGIHKDLALLRTALGTDGLGAVIGVTVVVGGAIVVFWKERRTTGIVLASAGIGAFVQALVFSYIQNGSPIQDVVRFETPTTTACALFGIYSLWPVRERTFDFRNELRSWRTGKESATFQRVRLRASSLATIVVIAAIGTSVFGSSPSYFSSTARTWVNLGVDVLEGKGGLGDRYAPFQPAYAQLNAAIPQGSYVLAAVTYPALLDFSRYRFATIDIVGSTSPAPHMPIFAAAKSVARYLEGLGFDYIVVDPLTDSLGLYAYWAWKADLSSPVYSYRTWARYFLQWEKLEVEFETNRTYHVRDVDGFSIISLKTMAR